MSANPEPQPRVSRGLVYGLLGVVVVALLGVFVILPMMSADPEVTGPDVAAADPGAVPAEPAATEEPATEEIPVVETFEVFSARDPFQQLVSDETASAVEGEPTATASPAPTTSEPVAKAPSDTVSTGGTTVVVDDVFEEDGEEQVLLTANGTAYTLGESDTFATNWKVESIDEPCVTLLFGDKARLVCEGESIRK